MKAVIFAGGLGTRLSEETTLKPKPMVQVGDMPMLWHIMKIYSSYGVNDFVVCLGYKGYCIKEYFLNYYNHRSDVTVNLKDNSVKVHKNNAEDWKITLVDTGLETMTGGRLKRVSEYLKDEEAFCLTYGDGVTNANIKDEIEFHKKHGKAITVLAVQPSGRFGALDINADSGAVESFIEKPKGDGNYINGGFFVCSPKVLNYITEGDSTVWEQKPLQNLARDGELVAYKHNDFWHPMDTLRDKEYLTNLWNSNEAPWKIW